MSTPTTLYLIRHGQTTYNASGRIQGWLDVPLDETGFKQARQLAERFRGRTIDAIYASPLQRAASTAQAIADLTGVEVRHDPRLREYNMGKWTGLTGDEIAATTPGGVYHDPNAETPIPDGETGQDMHDRIWPFMNEVLHSHPGRRVVAVSHGGTLAMAVAAALGMPVIRRQPFTFGNTAIAKLVYEHNRWRLRTLNDQCHLHVAHTGDR